MKTIAQFRISKDDGAYVAEGVDLNIVTQADNLESLMEHIREAVSLHLADEDAADLDFSPSPSILINYELPQHA